MQARAFTLIELLVVITIIVVLLALLSPALDKAIYQAELASCSARVRAIASGAVLYASASKRSYPYRPMVDDEYWDCNQLFINTGHVATVTTGRILDDRPLLKTIFPLNKTLNCPLAPKEVDLSHNQSDTRVFASYPMWFGVQYKTQSTIVSRHGMKKLGDRLAWTYIDAKTKLTTDYDINLLAGDLDMLSDPSNTSPQGQSSHPDADGKYPPEIAEDTTNTYASWRNTKSYDRGPLDTNFATDDTAVSRSTRVVVEDARMLKIPYPVNAYPTFYLQVPRR